MVCLSVCESEQHILLHNSFTFSILFSFENISKNRKSQQFREINWAVTTSLKISQLNEFITK